MYKNDLVTSVRRWWFAEVACLRAGSSVPTPSRFGTRFASEPVVRPRGGRGPAAVAVAVVA